MHGPKRVIAFCVLTCILPATLIIVPLYLKRTIFADVVYSIAESDIMEIRDGISSIFCQKHTLQMNTSFNAFQIHQTPEISNNRKHIRLKKSMTLPDDTLEYWGFYLLKGATVALKVCSRYDGSRILVVKGERNLKLCGLLEHNKNKVGATLATDQGKVEVFFEPAAEIIEPISKSVDNISWNNVEVTEEEKENQGGEDFNNDDDEDDDDDYYYEETYENHPKNLKNTNLHPSTTKVAENSQQIIQESNKKTEYQTKANQITETEEKEAIKYDTTTAIPQEDSSTTHRIRHKKSRRHDKSESGRLIKRDTFFDRDKIRHGGNYNDTYASDSVSSFENTLLTCYQGQILLARGFPPSKLCENISYLDAGVHMVTTHDVISNGYYYYIFYSDNDNVKNEIHAVFDIHKPTYLYSNLSESKECINSTHCAFPINFLSHETVVVEVPTRDGIEHEDDDITYLRSTCHPRMAIYVIFPILVLVLILSCAFL